MHPSRRVISVGSDPSPFGPTHKSRNLWSTPYFRHLHRAEHALGTLHATKDRIKSDTWIIYSISLYESTMTIRDDSWFGELKLTLSVIRLPVTVCDCILRCSLPVVGTERARADLISERWKAHTSILRAENELTSRCDKTLLLLVGFNEATEYMIKHSLIR